MSSDAHLDDDTRAVSDSATLPICEWCGCEIEVVGQDCPALDQGVCCP